MSEDIVHRLEAKCDCRDFYDETPKCLSCEASSTIEALRCEVGRLTAERAGAWVSKCFICNEVDVPRAACMCVACHVGREKARAEKAEAEAARLKDALADIARQKTSDEMGDDAGYADFEGGWDTVIKNARKALGETT